MRWNCVESIVLEAVEVYFLDPIDLLGGKPLEIANKALEVTKNLEIFKSRAYFPLFSIFLELMP